MNNEPSTFASLPENFEFNIIETENIDYANRSRVADYVAENLSLWMNTYENILPEEEKKGQARNLTQQAAEDALSYYFSSSDEKAFKLKYDEIPISQLKTSDYIRIQSTIVALQIVAETIRIRSQENHYYKLFSQAVESLFNRIYVEISTLSKSDTQAYTKTTLDLSEGIKHFNKKTN